MPTLRRALLDWQPDLDDYGDNGLTQADNVIHDADGWHPIHLASSGSFATTGGLAASSATILSIVTKPVGAVGNTFSAWIADQTAPTLQVGIDGVTATTSATGYPLTFTTTSVNQEIYAFDVCEVGGKIVWTVEAQAEDASGTALSIAFAGYMDF